MPPKRCGAAQSMEVSTSYKNNGLTHKRIERSSMTVGGNRAEVKQTTQRSVTVTPKSVCIKEVTKNERSITFNRNSSNQSVTAGSYENYSPAHAVQNYSPAPGARNYSHAHENQDYSPYKPYNPNSFY